MNGFKENLKVERDKTGRIIINNQLEKELITFMEGKISKNELMEITGIRDKNTVEIKIEELVAQKPELKELYESYASNKRKSFKDYDFLAETIEMLRGDYSQTEMAKILQVNRRTFSTKVKKLEEKNKDNILGSLLRDHADRNIKEARKKDTLGDKKLRRIRVNKELDEFLSKSDLNIQKLGRNELSRIKIKNIEQTLELINSLLDKGKTIKQLDEEGIISEATYRKYNEEAENMKKIYSEENKSNDVEER